VSLYKYVEIIKNIKVNIKLKMNLIESFLLLCLLKVVEINCHGRLLDPAARTSAWRFDNRFPAYYDDTAMLRQCFFR
jgi:hypothetical protein